MRLVTAALELAEAVAQAAAFGRRMPGRWHRPQASASSRLGCRQPPRLRSVDDVLAWVDCRVAGEHALSRRAVVRRSSRLPTP